MPSQEEYFAEGFDPASLKVPQLRNILVEHNIPIPGKAVKSDLVELFELHVRPKGNKLLAKAGKVKASARGIIAVSENGDEAPVEPPKRGRGRPRKTTSEDVVEPAPKRSRASTRASRTPAFEVEDDGSRSTGGGAGASTGMHSPIAEMEEIEPVKKVRGRPRKTVVKEEVGDDGAEAGIEDEPEKVAPVKTPRKSRARSKPLAPSPDMPIPPSAPASSSVHTELPVLPEPPKSILKRASSVTFEHPSSSLSPGPATKVTTPSKRKLKTPRRSEDGEDSGFSDANPFQSGNESAQKEARIRRKSTMGVREQVESSTPAAKTPRRSEPAPFSFTPGQTLRKMGPSQENLKSPPISVRKQFMQEREREIGAAEEHNRIVGNRLARLPDTPISGPSSSLSAGRDDEANAVAEDESKEPSPDVVVAHSFPDKLIVPYTRTESTSLSLAPRPNQGLTKASTVIPLSAILLPLLLWLSNWKSASSSIGYCDTNTPTNAIAIARESRRADARACTALRAEQVLAHVPADQLVACDYAALPLVPFMPHPTACAPCPAHAECTHGRIVSCEPEYLLTPSVLGFLEPVLGGLPGVGPQAFPPTCRPDTEKKRYVGEMAKALEGFLAQARGRVECARLDKGLGAKRGEGEVYGLKEGDLKGVFEQRRGPKVSQEQFDEVWEAALKDLVEHEDLVETIDVDGISWYAAKRSEMTLACSAKTQVYKSVDEWKSQLGLTMAVLAAIATLQNRFKTRRAEKYRAEELAQVVLKRLQDQQRIHAYDPSQTPHPHLPPAQLRDLVLPPKGSLASRTRTWQRVEALISKNANVATREKEVGGEVWNTWEWTGPVGAPIAIGTAEAEADVMALGQGDESGGAYGYDGYQFREEEVRTPVQRSPGRIKF